MLISKLDGQDRVPERSMIVCTNCLGRGEVPYTVTYDGVVSRETLAESFRRRIMDQKQDNWYFDWYLQDTSKYNVPLFEKEELRLTGESANERGPHDVWTSEEVGLWFTDGRQANYQVLLEIGADDETIRVRFKPGAIEILDFGITSVQDESLWDLYVKDGLVPVLRKIGWDKRWSLRSAEVYMNGSRRSNGM